MDQLFVRTGEERKCVELYLEKVKVRYQNEIFLDTGCEIGQSCICLRMIMEPLKVHFKVIPTYGRLIS